MKMFRYKKSFLPQNQLSTSSKSTIDPFLKSQSLFLQKFFRYNLSDYFSESFYNFYFDSPAPKTAIKDSKLIQSLTFRVNKRINIKQFSSIINDFYQQSKEQGSVCFKYLYANTQVEQLQINEKIIVWVKVRCEVQTLQNLPNHIYQELQRLSNDYTKPQSLKSTTPTMNNNIKDVINIFIVYFGDINFHLFNKKNYTPKQIQFQGRVSSVRIYVFYISRIGLINRFKKINKIDGMDCLNDLLIQLYEGKRQRLKNRRRKYVKYQREVSKLDKRSLILDIAKWTTTVVFAVGGLTFLYIKFIK